MMTHWAAKSRSDDLRERQRERLRDLKKAKANGFVVKQLRACSTEKCGPAKCRAACIFAAARRDAAAIPAVIGLLKNHAGPLYEVRLTHQHWQRERGHLAEAALDTVRKMNRRCLDKLYNPAVLSVGLIKASVSKETREKTLNPLSEDYPWSSKKNDIPMEEVELWRISLHQIVAGASHDELYRVFEARQWKGMHRGFTVDAVKDVKEVVARLFDQKLERRDYSLMAMSCPLSSAARREHLLWQLSLHPGELEFRYGCDRYYNLLDKALRTAPAPKPKKPRPYPHWLEPWQFGTWSREQMDQRKANEEYYNPSWRKRS